VTDVPPLPPQGIFISYRRADAAPYARLLQVELGRRFPDVRVFMDLDSIEPGLDFAAIIRDAVNSCRVMVALIGSQWATVTDEEGRSRLDDPGDYVRFEIRAALKRGVRTIPVLIDGAKMPRPEQLPHDLRRLARLHALDMSYDRYRYDADRLADVIGRALATQAGSLGAGHLTAPLEPPAVLQRLKYQGDEPDRAACAARPG
jgi:TIR domain